MKGGDVIQIHLNAARIEKIVFIGTSSLEEDYDFAAWVAIRPLVKQIDRRLQAIVKAMLSENTQPSGSQRPKANSLRRERVR